MNIALIASLSDTGHLAMRKLTWLKNLAVNAVTIIGLELAGHVPAGAAEAIGQHGYWVAVSDTTGDGDAAAVARGQSQSDRSLMNSPQHGERELPGANFQNIGHLGCSIIGSFRPCSRAQAMAMS